MPAEITFDPASGAMHIQDCAAALTAGMSPDAVRTALAAYYRDHRDHGNGYQWLNFHRLSLSGRPCCLSLCFREEKLCEASWALAEGSPGDWPDQEASEAEIKFMRGLLGAMLGRSFKSGEERFSWGVVWSAFDHKGACATSGLRYNANAVDDKQAARLAKYQ